MRSLKGYLSIGLLALGLAAVPATTHAQPACLYNSQTGVLSVLQIGQAGSPATPLLLGGYELYYTDGEWHQLPIVGNLNINAESMTLGWTTHYDWNSADWLCPVGDTVVKVQEGISMDVTYHGDDGTNCPISSTATPQLISCEGLYPFDPDLILSQGTPGVSSNAK